MTLNERLALHATFTCESCEREIPKSEYVHHTHHHAGTCRCTQAEHRIVAPWLRRGTFRRTGEQS